MPTATELKNMTLGDIVAHYPQARAVLEQFGLAQYAATETAKYENLEASARVLSIDPSLVADALVGAIQPV